VKRNGVFRARLVACGYSQVPGVDFTESFAPVLNDVSLRSMLISKLVWDMTSTVVDIETAFLHGNLDKEIYMDVPMGLSTVVEKGGSRIILTMLKILNCVNCEPIN
jgi:hypothetical protein